MLNASARGRLPLPRRLERSFQGDLQRSSRPQESARRPAPGRRRSSSAGRSHATPQPRELTTQVMIRSNDGPESPSGDSGPFVVFQVPHDGEA